MRLPGLGGLMLYATERHNYMTGCPEADCHASIRDHPIRVTSLQPDLAAPLRHADFRAGRDPAMDAIARDARRLPLHADARTLSVSLRTGRRKRGHKRPRPRPGQRSRAAAPAP